MVRNPWSNTYYSGDFRSSDPAWTDHFKSQVPYGVDPSTSWENGIFFIPDSDFHLAMEYFVVGHHRESQGYSSKWFDQEDDDGEKHTYVIDVPKVEGYLYFTVETYYNKIIPRSCTEDVVPYANIEIFRDGELQSTQNYYEQFIRPIMFYNWGGAEFTIEVQYDWKSAPTKEYTVQVYTD